MKTSLFTYVYNALSQGYPLLECIYSLLPIADELVIVDCGSNDGSLELIESFAGPNVKIGHDRWENGLGGRNHHKTGSLCHQLCSNEIIVFVEADEIWEPKLVESAGNHLAAGHKNLKFWRWQCTQNAQRVFWAPERLQLVHRIFPKGSTIMQGGTDIFVQDNKDAKESFEISNDSGYIIDFRNHFRDHYLARENTAKTVWSEQGRKTTRMAPAHAAYSWELTDQEVQKELADERWLWKHTILNIPDIMKFHLGKTRYEVRQDLISIIKSWKPN